MNAIFIFARKFHTYVRFMAAGTHCFVVSTWLVGWTQSFGRIVYKKTRISALSLFCGLRLNKYGSMSVILPRRSIARKS